MFSNTNLTELQNASNVWRPTQEGSSLLIRGFPSGPKPYEEVLTHLRKGSILEKYGRHGKPKFHHFKLGADDSELQWVSKGGRVRSVKLDRVRRFQRGQETETFKREPQVKKALLSFSIIYEHPENRKERTLDLICGSPQDFEVWYWGVQVVWRYPPSSLCTPSLAPQTEPVRPRGNARLQPPAPVDVTSRSLEPPIASKTPKLPVSASYNGALTLPPTPGGALIAASGPGGAGVAGSVDMGKRIGDLYVWGSMAAFDGSLVPQPQGFPCTRVDPMFSWQQGLSPALVHNTGGLNVTFASCGTRHAALITRNQELYTWGYGRGGALGHGSLLNVAAPQRVEGRWVQAHEQVQSASASDSCTAAITSGGRLYTWGSGLAGQLGHGDATAPVTQPKLVRAFADPGIHILRVSCGPYHTAAITSSGHLYTWGSGLFGRLGHGDMRSHSSPHRVSTLDGQCALAVSCGWWHTAAVTVPRQQQQQQGSTGTGTGGASRHGSLTAIHAATSTDANRLVSASISSLPPTESLPPMSSQLTMDTSRATSLTDSDLLSTTTSPSNTNTTRGLNGVNDSSNMNRQMDASTQEAWVEALRMGGHTGGYLYTWGGDYTWMDPEHVRAHTNANANGTATLGSTGGSTTDQSTPVRSRTLSVTKSESKLMTSPPRTMSDARPPQHTNGGALLHNTTEGDCPGSAKDSLFPTLSESHVTRVMAQSSVYKSGKRDNHKGCLGVGDLLGRLVPTRVTGDLEYRDVTQVACGWNLTLALTKDGQVFQMGCTGAVNSEEEKAVGGRGGTPWEGAVVPTPVDGALFGHHVEEVAVGMHHVAVVASKLSSNGRRPEDTCRTRLIMWGRGQAGQLGSEGTRDYNMPQIVKGVDGRRILHVACGGNHTMCVFEHDPRTRDTSKGHARPPTSTSYKEFVIPSPSGSLLRSSDHYTYYTSSAAGAITTPRVPSYNNLASYATNSNRASHPPPMWQPPAPGGAGGFAYPGGSGSASRAPSLQAGGGGGGGYGSGRALLNTAAAVLGAGSGNAVTQFVAQTVDKITTTVGTATAALAGRSTTPSHTHNTQHGGSGGGEGVRGSQDAHRHGRNSANGAPRLISMASGGGAVGTGGRRESSGYSDGDNGSRAHQRSSRLGRPGYLTASATGLPLPGNRPAAHRNPNARPGLPRRPSTGALSTKSSPGLVAGGTHTHEAPSPDSRTSPPSSLSGFDPNTPELLPAGAEGAEGSAVDAAGALRSVSDSAISGRDAHAALGAAGQANDMSVGSAAATPSGPSPATSGGHPPYLPSTHVPHTPYAPGISGTPQLQPGLFSPQVPHSAASGTVPHIKPWMLPSPASSQSPDLPWPGQHAAIPRAAAAGGGGGGGGADSPFSGPTGASIAGMAAYGDEFSRAAREGTFSSWSHAAAPPPPAGAVSAFHGRGSPLPFIAEGTSEMASGTFSVGGGVGGGLGSGGPEPSLAPHAVHHLTAGVAVSPGAASVEGGIHGPQASQGLRHDSSHEQLLPPPPVHGVGSMQNAMGTNLDELRAHNLALQQQVMELKRMLEASRLVPPPPTTTGPTFLPPQTHQGPSRTSAPPTRHMRQLSAVNLPVSASVPHQLLMDFKLASFQHGTAGSTHGVSVNKASSASGAATVTTPTSFASHGSLGFQRLSLNTNTANSDSRTGIATAPSVIRPVPSGSHVVTAPHANRPSVSLGQSHAIREISDTDGDLPADDERSPVVSTAGAGLGTDGASGLGTNGREHRSSDLAPFEEDVEGVTEGEGEGECDPNAPVVRLQHPFASAVSASPGGPADSVGSGASSVAGVVQAVGPAMLRTKAASILQNRHRRAHSVDVSRLSLAMTSPTQPHGMGFHGLSMSRDNHPHWHRQPAASATFTPADSGPHTSDPADAATQPTNPAPNTRAQALSVRMPASPMAIAGTRGGGAGGSAMGLPRVSTSAGGGGGSGEHSLPHSFAGATAPQVTGRQFYSVTVGGGLHRSWEVPEGVVLGGGGVGGGVDDSGAIMPPPALIPTQPSIIHPARELHTLTHTQLIPVNPAHAQTQGIQRQQWMEEIFPGVYAFIWRPASSAPPEIWKVRFSRRLFTEDAAKSWWASNEAAVAAKYPIRLQFVPNAAAAGAGEGSSVPADAAMFRPGRLGGQSYPGSSSVLTDHNSGAGLGLGPLQLVGGGSVSVSISPGSSLATPFTPQHLQSIHEAEAMVLAQEARGGAGGVAMGDADAAWLRTVSALPPQPPGLVGLPAMEMQPRRPRLHHQRSRSGGALPSGRGWM